MRCEHCDCGPDRHPPSSPCCYCGDDWNWPHLLYRVLYVPGMCAAIAARADRHRRMRFALMVEVEAERMYNIGGDMSCDDVAYQLRQVADNIRRCDP